MFIHYKLTRSKNNEVFDEGKIQFNIENDDHLIALDDIIQRIMSDYINNTEEVRKYGIAYVGKLEITLLEITDDDKIEISETEFKKYVETEWPYLQVFWNKSKYNTNL